MAGSKSNKDKNKAFKIEGSAKIKKSETVPVVAGNGKIDIAVESEKGPIEIKGFNIRGEMCQKNIDGKDTIVYDLCIEPNPTYSMGKSLTADDNKAVFTDKEKMVTWLTAKLEECAGKIGKKINA